MKHRFIFMLVLSFALVTAAVLPAAPAWAGPLPQDATPTPAAEEEATGEEATAEEPAAEAPQLTTASAVTELSNQFGRTLVTARGNTFVVDSAPPLGHPAEEMNPVEAMLASLGTCGLFIYETAAQELDIPMTAATFTLQGDFDVGGLSGATDANPRVQEFRAHADLEGVDAEQAAALLEQWTLRCPIYRTLIKSAPIVVTHNDEEMGGPSAEGLATAVVTVSLSNQPGRSIVNVRDNYLVVDSVPPLGGPNLEVNPLDLLLAAQGSCGAVIIEKAAIDNDIALDGVIGVVEADLDPRGLADPSIDSSLQAMRVNWEIGVDNEEDAQFLVDEWLARCPIYNTLELATDIQVSHKLMGEGTAVLDVTFTYDFDSADEYIAEVSPLAEQFAAVPGLVWKTWTLDPVTNRAGAVYLFENPEVRQAYMDGELFGAVKSHPALSDHRIRTYDVMRNESRTTHAGLRSEEGMAGESGDAGMLLDVEFTYDFDTADEYVAEVSPLAEQFAAIPGLIWKVWTLNPEEKTAGAAYYFADAESLEAYMDSELFGAVKGHPALSGHEISTFQVMAEESAVTYAPIEVTNTR